jgi:hypothetical protein
VQQHPRHEDPDRRVDPVEQDHLRSRLHPPHHTDGAEYGGDGDRYQQGPAFDSDVRCGHDSATSIQRAHAV